MSAPEPIQTAPCRVCGRRFPYEVLDSKPETGADPETSDWTRLECATCYGPGYLPL